ncbi:hypothetical protein AAE478_009141 [Parahypoxylon ruwenzoriense]
MVHIPPFEVEQWMDRYENTPGVLNIAETCAASVSIDRLLQFDNSRKKDSRVPIDFSGCLTYGSIRGSDELRGNIAAMYNEDEDECAAAVSIKDILITQGAISANHLVFYSLVGPGDHVICIFPTYQQLYSVPSSLGAGVSLWELKAENSYIPDIAELEHDIMVFSDEVYRPLFHSIEPDSIPPSAISMGYSKVVVTGSMSKAWALAGIRVGWIVSRDPTIIDTIASARDYTTISVSQLDDQVARYALSTAVRPHLLERNLALARINLQLLNQFVRDHAATCSWVKPTAGTTALVEFRRKSDRAPVDDVAFCKDVLDKAKVMFVPGSRCFGHGRTSFNGTVRIGYVNETEILRQALKELDTYLTDHLT